MAQISECGSCGGDGNCSSCEGVGGFWWEYECHANDSITYTKRYTEFHHFILKLSRGEVSVPTQYRECGRCGGTGVCVGCKGSGKIIASDIHYH